MNNIIKSTAVARGTLKLAQFPQSVDVKVKFLFSSFFEAFWALAAKFIIGLNFNEYNWESDHFVYCFEKICILPLLPTRNLWCSISSRRLNILFFFIASVPDSFYSFSEKPLSFHIYYETQACVTLADKDSNGKIDPNLSRLYNVQHGNMML